MDAATDLAWGDIRFLLKVIPDYHLPNFYKRKITALQKDWKQLPRE